MRFCRSEETLEGYGYGMYVASPAILMSGLF